MTATLELEEAVLPFDFDRDLLNEVAETGSPGMRIYPFDQEAVVAGRGSRLDRELDLDRIRNDHIPIYRRRGGGCAVYLDPGNLIVSIAFPAQGFGNVTALFKAASSRVLAGLERSGIVGIYPDGISDLVIKDRKIGGSCFHRTRQMAYYSAALLVHPDLDRMDIYLPHPPREPDYRRGRSHREFVAGLDFFFPDIQLKELAIALNRHLDISGLGK